MKNLLLSVVIVVALVAASVGGTFAGFVDTEESKNNFIQAGISDLLINGKNDPDVPAKVEFDHVIPGKSTDFWADAYNWGKCQGGHLYLHFKDVTSVEDGTKLHNGLKYVYDGVTVLGGGIPDGYKVAVPPEPQGPGVWSSEPEKIAEVGGGYIANTLIATTDPNLKGEDYATGVAQNLDVHVSVFYKGASGTELGNPDADGDGTVTSSEQIAWTAAGNRIVQIANLAGKLWDIKSRNVDLGSLLTQEKTFIHFDVTILQIKAQYDTDPGTDVDYDKDGDIDTDDDMLNWWPTNALQGDKATWTMLFSLVTDDPPPFP
jgi:hypothetical protein